MTTNVSALLPGQTRFRNLHATAKPDTPLAAALEAIPEWTAARDRLAALGPAQHNPNWQADADAQTAVDQLLRQAIDDGDDTASGDLEQRAVEAHNKAMGRSLIAAATTRLRTQIATELEAAVVANVDAIHSHLNDELTRLLAEGREVSATLRGVADLESAVDAGLVEEYRHLRDLSTKYGELRRQQSVVFAAFETQGRAMRTVPVAYLADPLAVDPDYIARSLNAPILTNDGQRPARPAPWPDDWTSAEAYRWQLDATEAKPWVPTRQQLADAQARIDDETNRARREMNDRRSAAINPERAAYRHHMLGAAGIA